MAPNNKLFAVTIRWLLLITLVHLFGLFSVNGSALNSGFITRINQKGLDLLADFLHDHVDRFMRYRDIPVNLSTSLGEEMAFEMQSYAVRAFDYEVFKSVMRIIPEHGLVWTGSHLTLTVGVNYQYTNGNEAYLGTADLEIKGTTVDLRLMTGVNKDGHLKTDLLACKATPGEVRVNFSAEGVATIGHFLPFIDAFASQSVEQVLCPVFHAELIPLISNRLMNTPMSAVLFGQYFINYGLTDAIHYTNTSVELSHRGNAYGILRQGRNRLNDFRLPFLAPPLHPPPEPKAMVDFYLSNQTFASLLFWMDQYRKFDYEISKESINNSQIATYLSTECGPNDICAGTLFPELSKRFPNGIVQIKTHTVNHPSLRIEKGKAVAMIASRIDAFVHQGARSRRFLTAGMIAEVALKKVVFKDYTLTGELHIEKFKITEVVSIVEGIDAQSLEFLVSALNEIILSDDLAHKLQDGIKLPIIFEFTQKDSEIEFEDGQIRVSANYCFEENCNTIEESNDPVDYYDAIAG